MTHDPPSANLILKRYFSSLAIEPPHEASNPLVHTYLGHSFCSVLPVLSYPLVQCLPFLTVLASPLSCQSTPHSCSTGLSLSSGPQFRIQPPNPTPLSPCQSWSLSPIFISVWSGRAVGAASPVRIVGSVLWPCRQRVRVRVCRVEAV